MSGDAVIHTVSCEGCLHWSFLKVLETAFQAKYIYGMLLLISLSQMLELLKKLKVVLLFLFIYLI